jgi:hypothetical protein
MYIADKMSGKKGRRHYRPTRTSQTHRVLNSTNANVLRKQKVELDVKALQLKNNNLINLIARLRDQKDLANEENEELKLSVQSLSKHLFKSTGTCTPLGPTGGKDKPVGICPPISSTEKTNKHTIEVITID